MENLDEADVQNESAFLFLCNLGLQLFINLSNARSLASEMLQGKQPVAYSDYTRYVKIADLLEQSRERCEPLKGEEDLPYASALEYIECMIAECNLFIRIHLSKEISMDDLCDHIDEREVVDKDAFNKLFLPDYTPDLRAELVSFENHLSDRTNLLFAQVLVSHELGI